MTLLGRARQRAVALAAFGSFVVFSWLRALVHLIQREQVAALTTESRRVADANREFVTQSQDWLALLWTVTPMIVTALCLLVLTLGIGHLLLIGTGGILGAVLLVTGVMFPSTLLLHGLAVMAVLALMTTLYLVLSAPEALLRSSRREATGA